MRFNGSLLLNAYLVRVTVHFHADKMDHAVIRRGVQEDPMSLRRKQSMSTPAEFL